MENNLKIVYKDIDLLIEPTYNPRKITAKQREDIKKSLQTFGFVQPLVVNIHPDRLNIVVGGNQRLKIAKAMGYTEAPCIEVYLEEQGEKELNLRLNKNQAEFDFEMLNEFFDKKFLFEVGFTDKEIGKIQSEFEEKFKAITNDNAEMPIVQQFNEKFSTIMIFCDNEMDLNWLRNVLKLQKMKDYKTLRLEKLTYLLFNVFRNLGGATNVN
jgi:hypothetical protein